MDIREEDWNFTISPGATPIVHSTPVHYVGLAMSISCIPTEKNGSYLSITFNISRTRDINT